MVQMPQPERLPCSSRRRSRRAFEMTETELKVIAALARTGGRRSPKYG